MILLRRLLTVFSFACTAIIVCWAPCSAATGNDVCLECHGSPAKVKEAAEALGVALNPSRIERLVFQGGARGEAHERLACVDCHPRAAELPHPAGMAKENPCATCHSDALKAINTSTHRDPLGGNSLRAQCWACHGAHDVFPAKDPRSTLHPNHVARRCLACHDKQEYLQGVHGYAVEMAGLDAAATCVSCHGGHDILSPREAGSRVTRRNISFTCGKCHGRVAETYRASVHGAALTQEDNPDVPACVDCHKAHATADPRSPRFRSSSPDICGKCHGAARMMEKYGLSTDVFTSYVADFHGTTAELFAATSPDVPLNQAVCFDCHGYHDVQRVKGMGQRVIDQRLLLRCQACHPAATFRFLSAWTGHYVPSPRRYALIYYVRLFYRLVIPSTVGFFLLYIAVDVWGRRRHRRAS